MYYKFSSYGVSEDQIKKTRAYEIHEMLENGVKWCKIPEELKIAFYTDNNGTVKSGGWCFDFSRLFKCYWVKVKYYGIIQIYAPNKTYIRQHYPTPSHIIKIVEVN